MESVWVGTCEKRERKKRREEKKRKKRVLHQWKGSSTGCHTVHGSENKNGVAECSLFAWAEWVNHSEWGAEGQSL